MRVKEKLDPLFEDAVVLTRDARKGSTSVLQKGLGIGYGRAVQLIDLMEQEGIVGPADGLNPRKILRKRSA
jgi:DNA segregation ATPase FtsK/SpoIIIE, S-DNA-T family